MGDNHRRAVTIIREGILVALIFLIIYGYVYWCKPFQGSWNDIVVDLFDAIAVGLTAIAATAVWRRYRKSEKLYSIWRFFTFGLYAWLLADLIWAIYNVTVVEVPELSFADLFYILGYCFIFIALHRQYRLLFHPTPRRDAVTTGMLAAAVFLLSLLLTPLVADLEHESINLAELTSIFYPIGDLAIVIVALIFLDKFGRGVFARPWLGLMVFTIADGLYAWLYQSGNYAFSVLQANLGSLVADTLYNTAYLTLTLLLINHYLLLKFGPSVVGDFGKIKKQVFANPLETKPD